MGHGDYIVIADANFPSDSIAAHCKGSQVPIRIRGTTAALAGDMLTLFPKDRYTQYPVQVMQRVPTDEQRNLQVPAYAAIAEATDTPLSDLGFVERFKFYDIARGAFAIVQTDDRAMYANIILYKGVI
jgi:L-fucose mutarotase